MASMEEFYKDALRFGCLQGFKHFSLYLRGREELLVTVFHGDDGAEEGMEATMDTICESNASVEGTGAMHPTRRWSPRAQPAKTNAKTVQSNVLVPASPASREAENESPSETVFLVGAYAKYEWPYVWLRSNHASRRRGGGGRGGKSRGGGGAKAVPGDGVGAGDEDDGGDDDDDDTRDLPLDLTTTQRWKVGKHRVWDVVEELVNMNVFPNPVNPFAVNHSHLRRKPQDERFLATGAMVSFLRDLLAGTGDGADERMGFGRGGGDGAGGGGGGADERAAGKRLAGLSLGGGGGVGKGRFAAAVEADLNQLVATHLAALPGGLVAGAAQC